MEEAEETEERTFDDLEIKAGFRRMVGKSAVGAAAISLITTYWSRDRADVPLMCAQIMFACYALWLLAFLSRKFVRGKIPDDVFDRLPKVVRHILGFAIISIYGILIAAVFIGLATALAALMGYDYGVGLRAALTLMICVPIIFALIRVTIDLFVLTAPQST